MTKEKNTVAAARLTVVSDKFEESSVADFVKNIDALVAAHADKSKSSGQKPQGKRHGQYWSGMAKDFCYGAANISRCIWPEQFRAAVADYFGAFDTLFTAEGKAAQVAAYERHKLVALTGSRIKNAPRIASSIAKKLFAVLKFAEKFGAEIKSVQSSGGTYYTVEYVADTPRQSVAERRIVNLEGIEVIGKSGREASKVNQD